MISATANSAEENQIFYILYPATTLEEAYEISDVLYPECWEIDFLLDRQVVEC